MTPQYDEVAINPGSLKLQSVVLSLHDATRKVDFYSPHKILFRQIINLVQKTSEIDSREIQHFCRL